MRKVLARFLPDGGTSVPAVEPLTERELEVLRLAAQGKSNKQIARQMDLSARTVQVHVAHVFQKLGVASRTEAVVRALRLGLLGLEELE